MTVSVESSIEKFVRIVTWKKSQETFNFFNGPHVKISSLKPTNF